MNPQAPSKPVMDVSAPRQVASQTPQPASPVSSQLPVRPAPIADNAPPAVAPVAANQAIQQSARPQNKQPARAAVLPQSSAPTGVITIAVLVMMALSALAVVVYMTSQS